MLDKIIESAKGNVMNKIGEQFGLKEQQAEETFSLAGDSIVSGLKNEALSGNLDGILDLFSGKAKATKNHPVINNIMSGFMDKLISKLGLGKSAASGIAGMAIPMIMDLVSKHFSEQGGKIDIGDITKLLGMNDAGNLLDKLPGGLGKKLGGLFG